MEGICKINVPVIFGMQLIHPDKTTAALEAIFTVTYPVYVVTLKVLIGYHEYAINRFYILAGLLSVSAAARDDDESWDAPGNAWSAFASTLVVPLTSEVTQTFEANENDMNEESLHNTFLEIPLIWLRLYKTVLMSRTTRGDENVIQS